MEQIIIDQKIIALGNKMFICELRKIKVKDGKRFIERCFCKEIKEELFMDT